MAQAAPASSLAYERTISPLGGDSLSRLARRVSAQSRVLDLGAGPGELGRFLVENKQCSVDGVELDAAAVASAERYYRRLVRGDLDELDLTDVFPKGSYDFVACADVLEHLRRPERVLAQCRALLAPRGRLIVSVPNVAYAGVAAELLAGEFRYRPSGILDTTHVRFYTHRSLLELLHGEGLEPVHLERVVAAIAHTEFSGQAVLALPEPLARWLAGRPEALTYQFIVECAATGEGAVALAETPQASTGFDFFAELFWRRHDEPLAQERSVAVQGRLGPDRQTLSFTLPPTAGVVALRLDPTERPGPLLLHRIRLLDRGGDCTWQWSGDAGALVKWKRRDLTEPVALSTEVGVALESTSMDPSLEPDPPVEALGCIEHGARLEVELTAPVSAELGALERALVDLPAQRLATQALENERAALQQSLVLNRREVEDGRVARQALEAKLQALDAMLAEEGRQRAAQLARAETLQLELTQATSALASAKVAQAREARALERAEQQRASMERQLHSALERAAQVQAEHERLTGSLAWRLLRPMRLSERLARRALGQVAHQVVPRAEVVAMGDGRFVATGRDPQLDFDLRQRLRGGSYRLTAVLAAGEGVRLSPRLYFGTAGGFAEPASLPLDVRVDTIDVVFELPADCQALRLDPCDCPGPFLVRNVSLRALSKVEAAARKRLLGRGRATVGRP